MTFEDKIRQREKEALKAQADFIRESKTYEAKIFAFLLDRISQEIETDGVTVSYSTSNLRATERILGGFSAAWQKMVIAAAKTMLRAASFLFDLNEDYFDSKASFDTKQLFFASIGYDFDTKNLITGGYLSKVLSSESVAQQVAGILNVAISTKQPLKEFRKNLAALFLRQDGGIIAEYFKVKTFDFYQMVDRIANKLQADALGLRYAIYSGTVMATTRQFCRERVNKVFSTDEIEAWANQSWSGKPKTGYDPFSHCGGYACRHHLSFVSDTVAKALRS